VKRLDGPGHDSTAAVRRRCHGLAGECAGRPVVVNQEAQDTRAPQVLRASSQPAHLRTLLRAALASAPGAGLIAAPLTCHLSRTPRSTAASIKIPVNG
jgi:hypothetical protein